MAVSALTARLVADLADAIVVSARVIVGLGVYAAIVGLGVWALWRWERERP